MVLTDQISLFDCLYFVRDWTCFPICDVMNFEINFSFVIKLLMKMSGL